MPLRSTSLIPASVLLFLFLAVTAPLSRAQNPLSSSEANPILQKIYSFQLQSSVEDAQRFEQAHPEDPLGYLLEGEALGWKLWCTSAEFKYGFTDARHRPKLREDQRYFKLATKVTSLAQTRLKARESPQMHFYAGMGYVLAARLYGLRGENRNVARAGVRAREQFLRALELDPHFADAEFGLGLYNYYVDTLSSFAKILRFFMGIPGGNKQAGILQLQHAVANGELTRQDAGFYLALNSIKYDQRYERALDIITPLSESYPANPLFLLVRGDALSKLGRRDQAIASYRAAAALTIQEPDCSARTQQLARASLAALGAAPEQPPAPY